MYTMQMHVYVYGFGAYSSGVLDDAKHRGPGRFGCEAHISGATSIVIKCHDYYVDVAKTIIALAQPFDECYSGVVMVRHSILDSFSHHHLLAGQFR